MVFRAGLGENTILSIISDIPFGNIHIEDFCIAGSPLTRVKGIELSISNKNLNNSFDQKI